MSKERKPFSGFNADQRAEERRGGEIVIGGRSFRAKKKTGAVVKGVIEAAPDQHEAEYTTLPDGSILRDGKGNPVEKPQPKERQKAGIDHVYQQVASVIIDDGLDDAQDDEAKRDARAEFLNVNLDIEDARELMTLLMPSGEEDDDEGNS